MPRKKVTAPIVFGDNGPAATRRSRGQKIITDIRKETGDPKKDGEIWLSRIAMERQARAQRDNGESQWRQYYRWFKGKQWNDRGGRGGNLNADNARDTATVNKIGSICQSIVPFLINDEIKFLLKPQREDDDLSAQIQQALLNYEWRKRKMTKAIKSCARDLVIIGHCVAKVGYTVEVDESKAKGETINYAEYIKRDAPYIERVNPLNFLFDTSAKDHTLHTARWCAEVFFVPYADVLDNKSYDPETLSMMRGGDITLTTRQSWETQGMDNRAVKAMRNMRGFALPEDNLVALIEIWDWKHRNRMIFADGCKRPLLFEEWPYAYLDKFPYSMATYIEVPNEPYGLGVPGWIEDQAMQLNRANTLEQDVMRNSRPRTAASEGTNEAELKKFIAGDDVVVGEFKVIQAADLSQMFQVYKQNLERVIEEMTGADALLQGARLPSRTTAGEIGTRARLTGLKLDQHVEDFEEFVEECAGQVLKHLKKFRTTNDVIEIVGNDGSFWQPYTNEEIQAEVDVDVEYFAAPKTDIELEKQQALQVLQLGVQAIPLLAQVGAEQTIDPVQLFGWVFDRFGEKDISRFFKSSRTPMPDVPEGAGTQNGLPPGVAGMLAPAQIPGTPEVGAPGEGLETADLQQSMRGFMR